MNNLLSIIWLVIGGIFCFNGNLAVGVGCFVLAEVYQIKNTLQSGLEVTVKRQEEVKNK